MKEEEEGFDLPKGWVDCNCPCCKRDHRMRIPWSGKIPARKLCRLCREKSEKLSRGIQPITITISGRDVDFHLSKKEKASNGH